MGAYNILITSVNCANCNNFYLGNIQFKYGDTWQIKYELGDKIKWGKNDIGIPNQNKVKAYGILDSEKCPICGELNQENEFDIYIESDVIKSVSLMKDLQEYFIEDGNYKIITS